MDPIMFEMASSKRRHPNSESLISERCIKNRMKGASGARIESGKSRGNYFAFRHLGAQTSARQMKI